MTDANTTMVRGPTGEFKVNAPNRWRLDTPGSAEWARSPRAGTGKKKYFMVSVDSHLSPPPKLFHERIDRRYVDRLPRIETRDGRKFIVQEGLRAAPIVEFEYEDEDLVRIKAGASISTIAQNYSGSELRVAEQSLDGVDAEVVFPNGAALLMFASRDVDFVMAQCAVWNDWAIEYCRPVLHRCSPVATIGTADVDKAVKEVERVARLGYRAVFLPSKPIWGESEYGDANYNLPVYDPLWAAIQDADLAATFHISSGKDPRTARGNGGAVMNYVLNAAAPTMEPVVALCASGVIERFPKLRFATIEANAGWLPWLLDMMDEACRKHHFWTRPKLKQLPSEYFRSNGAASIAEDRSALLLAEHYGLEGNLMWANDFPHHEGSWPHSAEAIERNFAGVSENARTCILGMNAARFFRFDVPAEFRDVG